MINLKPEKNTNYIKQGEWITDGYIAFKTKFIETKDTLLNKYLKDVNSNFTYKNGIVNEVPAGILKQQMESLIKTADIELLDLKINYLYIKSELAVFYNPKIKKLVYIQRKYLQLLKKYKNLTFTQDEQSESAIAVYDYNLCIGLIMPYMIKTSLLPFPLNIIDIENNKNLIDELTIIE